jgi:hypothetical protein
MPQKPLPMEIVGYAGEFHRKQIADLTSTVNIINDNFLETLLSMLDFTPLTERQTEVILAAYNKLKYELVYLERDIEGERK